MQRYMVNNKNLILDESDKKHIITVMRMNVGDEFQIVYDKVLYTCKITNIGKRDVEYSVVKKEELKSNKDYKVIIAFSLIKEQKMDIALQKMTELGVDEIIPIITERTVINKKDSKLDRWNRILKEASEQSHRIDIPKLHEITNINDILKIGADLKMVCDTKKESKIIKKVMQDSKKSDTIMLVVGPEGGFTSDEISLLNKNKFESVSLGENILRAETVPIYLLSIINYEFYGR